MCSDSTKELLNTVIYSTIVKGFTMSRQHDQVASGSQVFQLASSNSSRWGLNKTNCCNGEMMGNGDPKGYLMGIKG